MNPTLMFFLAVGLLLVLGFALLRKHTFNKILEAIGEKKFEKAESIINSWAGNLSLSKMNQKSLLLSCKMGMNDSQGMMDLIDTIGHLTADQQELLLQRAFAWSIEQQDPKQAKAIMTRSKKKEDMELQIRVLLDHDTSLIEPITQEVNRLSDCPRKGVLAYLVAVQYQNKGQEKQADSWFDLSRKLLLTK